MKWPFSIALVLALVPGWSGTDRLPIIASDAVVHAAAYVPDGGWPRGIGALTPIGAVRLWSRDPAFGGLSALSIDRGVATLLSDGGNYVRISIRRNRIVTHTAGAVPDGPGTGWSKETRDTESLAIGPAGGHAWVGYERANAIWRYSADLGRVEAHAKPAAMREWPMNGGAESMVRLNDGRFVVISEQARVHGKGRLRQALLFDGDPTAKATRVARFRYRAPDGYNPSDATVLPNGDLLVLNRRFHRLRFDVVLVRIPPAEIRAGATVRGVEIARWGPPLLGENPEGLAVTQEAGHTILWIVTDNDLAWYRPTLLMKFRLN
ncbi:esterase-like activity of phytase family protein [Sphingomonas sp. Mn802worker]|uniref:esterase-like activity of phytase family protein n=1 Tax=Sphingomonas sp. Mn802worker TaxID=629773 RepID=UPI000370B92C|nr:esterase-like activity of phytase family protein [Sphingomonas sp. Mn802worker]